MTNKRLYFILFALLYFAQGAITSYFSALNALYLLSYKVSLGQIGIIGGIAMIPFMLKIFLGMLSDRVNLGGMGHRKPYILIGLMIQAVCLFLVVLINPATQFWLFALTAFVLMSGMALYDTCTDGLALDTVAEEDQGKVQGIMVAGRAAGVVLISAVIGFIVQHTSWSAAFWTLGILTLLPIPLVLMVREKARSVQQNFQWEAFSAFAQPSIIAFAVFGALYSLIINAATEIVNPFMQHSFQISVSTAGLLTTVWGLGIILGSLTGGRLTDLLGQHRTTLIAVAVSFISIAALAAINNPMMGWLLIAAFGVGYGFYETIYFALAMRATDRRIAASMFSILMAVANIGTGIGLALSGSLSDNLGFRNTFLILAGLNIFALPLLALIFPQNKPGAFKEG